MTIQGINKCDLNNNLFSSYDYSALTLQELISNFASKLNECVDEINEMGGLFNYLTGIGLSQEVAKSLTSWLNDGTLETIINETIFTDLNDTINKFKLDHHPFYVTSLYGHKTSVMQTFIPLSEGDYLFSQVGADGQMEGAESFTVSRVIGGGSVLSHMNVINGGHGVITASKSKCGDVWIYFTNNKGELYKMPYIPSTFNVAEGEGVTLLPKYSNDYQLMSINQDENKIMLVNKNTEGKYYCAYVYDLDTYETGTPNLVHRVNNLMNPNDVLQGFAYSNNKAYVLSGEVGGVPTIREHDLLNCTYKDYYYPLLGKKSSSDNIVVEAEGMYIDSTGLWIGASLGDPTTLRANNIYKFTSITKLQDSISNTLENMQSYKLTEGDGRAKWYSSNSKRLSDITETGSYYFTATQFAEIIDVPYDYKKVESGFWLHVSAKAKDGAVQQELRRNTAGDNVFIAYRNVSGTNVSNWRSTPEHKTLWSKDSRSLTTLELNDSIFNYEFVLFRVWSPSGKWDTTYVRTDQIQLDKKVIFSGANIGDSEGSITYYPYEMHVEVSEDGMTLTQTIKTELVINPPNETTRRECSVGIHNIQGFRGINTLTV